LTNPRGFERGRYQFDDRCIHTRCHRVLHGGRLRVRRVPFGDLNQGVWAVSTS
jgi:hypothetical protein